MAIFVLVHGAWGGAHGFRKVRGPLQAAGHSVFTPSLTGIGERVHLAGPQVCLTTHVTDVVNTVLYEDLDEIVLLGFSHGGFVVTGAPQHIGDRVLAVPGDHHQPHDRKQPASGTDPAAAQAGVSTLRRGQLVKVGSPPRVAPERSLGSSQSSWRPRAVQSRRT